MDIQNVIYLGVYNNRNIEIFGVSYVHVMQLADYNLHWRPSFSYGFPIRRDRFSDLVRVIGKHTIIVVTGMRRTGKTTMMKQAIDHLVSSGVARDNILFYSFDEPGNSIESVVKEYERGLVGVKGGDGGGFVSSKETFYIFLDEVQKVPGWQEQVKYYFDHVANVRLLVSGSSALFLRKDTRESLAGRTYEMMLGPLSFAEYLRFAGKSYMLEKVLLHEDELGREYERYLTRQFIDTVSEDDTFVREYLSGIIEKVVYIDIPRRFGTEGMETLMSLVRMMASRPGLLLNLSTLAGELGLDRHTLSNYIGLLRDSFLVRVGYNFSRSAIASERKMKKAYLSNPAFSLLSHTPVETPRLVECDAFVSLGARSFWMSPAKDEVDIVLMNEKVPIPVEVKYKDSITNEDMRGVRKFMRRFKVKRAFLITRSLSEDRELPEGMVHAVPAFKVALDPGMLLG